MMVSLAALLLSVPLPSTCGSSGEREVPRGGPRPALSGEVLTADSDDGFFRVHYTLEGDDAVPADDEDASGVPDDVERMIAGLQEGRRLFEDLGYRSLLLDDGAGGSDALDVYVGDIDAFGYAYPIEIAEGESAHSCTMQLDRGLRDQGQGVLESVAVHELHHCIQYTYTPFAASWIYEATATLEQYRDRRSGPLDAALEFLWAFRLRDHVLPIEAVGDRFEYAGFVFLKFWEEFEADVDPVTDAERVPDLWEALAENPVWEEAFDVESRRRWSMSWDRVFREFATWNLFACARGDGTHYDPFTFPCTLPNTSVRVQAWDLAADLTIEHESAPYTATFYEVAADGDARPVVLDCSEAGEGAEVRLRLVALDAVGRRGETADATLRGDEGATLRLNGSVDPAGRVALVAAGTGTSGAFATCSAARVAARAEPPPAEDEGEGCACNNGDTPSRSAAAVACLFVVGLRARTRSSRASSSR